ncbi:hypothetical protein QO000_003968 [Alkalihalobacillus hemicentroti]|uniref:Uncharacterized protein n=1 Tax=Guptibacillus hwajinpoensis TaxID=208199 RepID=A0ABU0K6P6_9BACL|nr:hypothetical protein [Alkalihalobacillus hemicentroti]
MAKEKKRGMKKELAQAVEQANQTNPTTKQRSKRITE